jgi:hypothetical protein
MASRILDDYLVGSYARDTAIAPIDDVDIVFVIDPEYWQDSLSGFLGMRPQPRSVITTFANAIRYRYPDSSVRTQRRSVRLQMNHLDIDVVPALSEHEDPRIIRIPDIEEDTWIETAPKIHTENATDVNQRRSGLFKPLVKILKYWNSNLPAAATMKSLLIETIAVRLFMAVGYNSLGVGLSQYLDFVTYLGREEPEYEWNHKYEMDLSWWSSSVRDVTPIGRNLADGLDNEHRRKFIQYAMKSRDLVFDALESDDENEIVDLLRRIFRN